jgi:magnesium-transporting ATPase (P-type)
VGISIAGSTDVALETADVVLLDGGLSRLEKAFRISDQAMSSVRQNLGVIVVPNAIAIALGACGFITPAVAAIINNGATMLAVLVGTLPLLRVPSRRPQPEVESALTSSDDAPGASGTAASHERPRLVAASGRG